MKSVDGIVIFQWILNFNKLDQGQHWISLEEAFNLRRTRRNLLIILLFLVFLKYEHVC